MTDPIREIIERMRQEVEGCLDCANPDDPFTKAMAKYLSDVASRLSAYWTPERQAFMEAAIMWANWYDRNMTRGLRLTTADLSTEEADMLRAYRALVESEKRDG